MGWSICGNVTDLEKAYDRGFRDGFRQGMKEFDRKHAAIMAQLDAVTRAMADIDIMRPRIIVMDKGSLPE